MSSSAYFVLRRTHQFSDLIDDAKKPEHKEENISKMPRSDIKQVYLSKCQYECEPPIPLSILIIYEDGTRDFFDNDLTTEDLFDKYGQKLSPMAFELSKAYKSFFEPEKIYTNIEEFPEVEGFY